MNLLESSIARDDSLKVSLFEFFLSFSNNKKSVYLGEARQCSELGAEKGAGFSRTNLLKNAELK